MTSTESARRPHIDVPKPNQIEVVQPTETWEFVDLDGIVIGSSIGAGGTTQADMMKEKFNIPTLTVHKAGELRRTALFESTGRYIEEGEDSDPQLERDTDKITQRILRNSSPENPAIVEAQMGGYAATKLIEQQKENHKSIPQIERFLLVVEENEGAERVMNRELAKGREGDLEFWKHQNRVRKARNMKNWRNAYDDLRGVDIHDAMKTDRNGVPIWTRFYDHVIDTTGLTPEQVHNQMIITMWEKGKIRPKSA